jgi:secreted trypsin-like serine protease
MSTARRTLVVVATATTLTAGLASPAPAVVGGGPTTIAEHPSQVAVVVDESQLCSGALITPTVVLTAAHCVAGRAPEQVEVYAGITDLAERAPQDAQQVAAIAPHPAFVPAPRYANDIALLTLTAAVPGTTGARTIALPVGQDGSSWPAAGTPAAISGWGATDRGSAEASSVLQAATVQVLSDPGQPCGSYGGIFDPATSICGGLPSGEVDTCQGDSGGPFVVDVAGRPVLAGTVVGGSACASAAYPGLYSRLTAYLPWISAQGVDVAAAAAAAGQPLASPSTPAAPPSIRVGTRITAGMAAQWAGVPSGGAKVTAKRTAVCRPSGTRVVTTKPGTCTVRVTQGGRTSTLRITVTR